MLKGAVSNVGVGVNELSHVLYSLVQVALCRCPQLKHCKEGGSERVGERERERERVCVCVCV